MPWRSIPFSTRDENEYIKLIVVLISHPGTLSLTPHLAYVVLCHVFWIQDFSQSGHMSPLWTLRHVVYA